MSTANKLNRTELIEVLATEMGTSKVQAEKFLNTFVGVITDSLVSDKEVNITGFGVFRKTTRKARKGVNPKTREPMNIPASTSVSFKVGKTLKEAVK